MSLVVALTEVSADVADLVGGKAAGLGELIRGGERVPPGFCVTTRAYRSGTLPRAEILAAYQRLGSGPVAVRSSATAEDLPDASFAGQQDTVLDVTGPHALLAAVETCWASLHSARAVAYRRAHGLDDPAVAMAVIVQRMVDAQAGGVLFTANPLTGRRTEMLVDAAPGPGTAVVDGSGTADHYVLEGSPPAAGGCLTAAQLDDLRATGARVEAQFGVPQDVEWAIDRQGTTWLLQSRPITTLFPAPPDTGDTEQRVYLEFGHAQGMLQPVTPLGMSTLRTLIAGMLAPLGIRADIVDIGGRLYGDLTDMVRDPATRRPTGQDPRGRLRSPGAGGDASTSCSTRDSRHGVPPNADPARPRRRCGRRARRSLASAAHSPDRRRPGPGCYAPSTGSGSPRLRRQTCAARSTGCASCRTTTRPTSPASSSGRSWPACSPRRCRPACWPASPPPMRSTPCSPGCRTTSPSRWTWRCGGSPRARPATVNCCSTTPPDRVGRPVPARRAAGDRARGVPGHLRAPWRRRGRPRRAALGRGSDAGVRRRRQLPAARRPGAGPRPAVRAGRRGGRGRRCPT